MALDAEQEEQLSAFKAFLEQYGNWIVGICLIVVAAAAGNWGWRWYVQRDAAAAATIYEQYGEAVSAKDSAKARDLAAALLQQHASSAYASFAALSQARSNLDAGDTAAAKAQLHWVIDKSSSKELATLARVRLAGLLLDEKAYDEGLGLLQADAPAALAAEVSDRRGDLLLAQGKAAEARAAYGKALEQASTQNPLRAVIQSKFDALPAAS
jgi:predicted negative regulator of RcsB-dependent stress response